MGRAVKDIPTLRKVLSMHELTLSYRLIECHRALRGIASCFTLSAIVLALAITSSVVQAKSSESSAKRPNVLFIITDDQSPLELRCYNRSSQLETPTLDRLAARGMTVEGAYHMGSFMGAVCTPSRHMIMTGRTLWHLPSSVMERVSRDFPTECPSDVANFTMGQVFRSAGYDTMRTCKRGNSYPEANDRFEVSRVASKLGPTDSTGSAWHAEQVLGFLERRQSTGSTRPFLVYLGFSHPHDPRNGKPELLSKYGATNHQDPETLPSPTNSAPPLPTNYLPAHPFPTGHPNLRDEMQVAGVWANRDERTIRNELGRYYACCENIDTQVGRVIARLEETGELDNTYVIFTSDHGIAIGRHGLQGKQNLYEHTWRVPLLLSGPGIAPGTRAKGNVYLHDVLPTICDITEVPCPESVEGLSMRSVLERKSDTLRDVMYGVYSGGTKPGIRCVRRGDWKLIEYDVLDGQIRRTQLFNLAQNPDELLVEHSVPTVVTKTGNEPSEVQRDLSGDPRYATVLQEMETLLLSQMRTYDDPYRLWSQPKDGVAELSPPIRHSSR